MLNHRYTIRGSSNGRTVAFEAAYRGSNPCPRANEVSVWVSDPLGREKGENAGAMFCERAGEQLVLPLLLEGVEVFERFPDIGIGNRRENGPADF